MKGWRTASSRLGAALTASTCGALDAHSGIFAVAVYAARKAYKQPSVTWGYPSIPPHVFLIARRVCPRGALRIPREAPTARAGRLLFPTKRADLRNGRGQAALNGIHHVSIVSEKCMNYNQKRIPANTPNLGLLE
ncbi:hypothetical protein NDU88_007945 [Pleurodeles waltl]|uniref:Secreted protein n=1 Tax=Pleurodeles waltl TaxID=8319 RepID=A0AAV7NUL1_PLEWA|nr:hypothetical protein NDU88_007945 [Pleurodeles waltl]